MSNHLMREVKGEYWLNKGSSFFADKLLTENVTVGIMGEGSKEKNVPEVQPFPHVDTSISISVAKSAEPNVMP